MTCFVQITINYEANFSCLASLLVDELFCFRLTVDLKSEAEWRKGRQSSSALKAARRSGIAKLIFL